MILAEGEIVTASKTERADLFHDVTETCGSLGITTLVELQLIEAKKYVKTTYHPIASMPAAVERIQQFTKAKDYYDYVDGILFSKDQGAIITGRLTNERANDDTVRTFSYAKDP